MKLAILKPDHFGDLILSAAAIRAVLSRHPAATLLVAEANVPLCRALFGPGCSIRPVSFPHLQKMPAPGRMPDLAAYDLVLILRRDNVLDPAWAMRTCRDFLLTADTADDHQSVLDYGVASRLLGPYDIDAWQLGPALPAIAAKAQAAPRQVGLCIGSGFHANVWPAAHWIALGRMLQADGIRLSVVCGPREAGLAALIARQLQLPPRRIIAGHDDIAATRHRLDELDWVIASDGGTAHLCALHAPVLSIFGPSPWRRYAPFGAHNRLLTQSLDCAPCCQWARHLLNGCLTAECMAGVMPADLHAALHHPLPACAEPGSIALPPHLTLQVGASHADRARKLAARIDFFTPAPVPAPAPAPALQ